MRYSIILVTGLILFISGTMSNEIVVNKNKLLFLEITRLIIISLSLAIGIGMISGGVSHFKESPNYVSYLIPTGIIISLISFAVKNNYKLNKQSKMKLDVTLLIVGFVIHLTLGFFSLSMLENGGVIFNNMNNMHK